MIPKDLIMGDWLIDDKEIYALFLYYEDRGPRLIMAHNGSALLGFKEDGWRKCTTNEKKLIRSKLKNALKKQTESEYQQSYGR